MSAFKIKLKKFKSPAGAFRLKRAVWPWGVLIFLTLAVYFWNLSGYGLIDPEEGRFAETAREMLESGDFITPRLNYTKYFEKPVLHYWLTAGAFLAFGQNEAAARLTPVVLGLCGCVLTFFLAERVTRTPRAGGLAAMVLATSALWFTASRLNLTDMTATFFFTLSLLGYRLWFEGETQPPELPVPDSEQDILARMLFAPEPQPAGPGTWLLLFYGAAAPAMLSGGLRGAALPLGIAALHLVLTRRWRSLFHLLCYLPGLMLFFIIAVPWLRAVCRASPEYFRFFFSFPFVISVTGNGPFWYFLPVLLLAFIPWTGMSLDVLHTLRGKWDIVKRDDALLLGLWVVVPFVTASFSDFKRVADILPCMPPVAVLIGAAMETTLRGDAGSRRMVLRFTGLNAFILLPVALACWLWPGMADVLRMPALALLAFWLFSFFLFRRLRRRRAWVPPLLCIFAFGILASGFPMFQFAARWNSQRDIAAMVNGRLDNGEAVVIVYKNLMPGLPFYLKRRVAAADVIDTEETRFSAERETDPGWFIDRVQLRRLWNGPNRVLLVARREDAGSLEDALGREPVRVGETPGAILFTNF